MNELFNDMSALHCLFWFTTGALGYRLISTLVGYISLASYAKRVNESALALIMRTSDDLIFARQIKYRYLESMDVPGPIVEEIKNKDVLDYNNWAVQVMGYFNNSYPSSYLKTVDFDEWKKTFKIKE